MPKYWTCPDPVLDAEAQRVVRVPPQNIQVGCLYHCSSTADVYFKHGNVRRTMVPSGALVFPSNSPTPHLIGAFY